MSYFTSNKFVKCLEPLFVLIVNNKKKFDLPCEQPNSTREKMENSSNKLPQIFHCISS